ncbi:MAG: hypothetical protein HZC40_04185 [Chloroflexi bacterium]|nr:hypothetical protein [Chloroflexota bacterium]
MKHWLVRYFGFGLLQEISLGTSKRRPAWQNIVITVAMYIGIVCGVLADYFLTLFKTAGTAGAIQPDAFSILRAWLTATLIFPLVYPKIFGPLDTSQMLDPRTSGFSVRVLQFFVAFQNGFFWHAVL